MKFCLNQSIILYTLPRWLILNELLHLFDVALVVFTNKFSNKVILLNTAIIVVHQSNADEIFQQNE